MNKFYLIILGTILFFRINSFATNGDKSNYSIVEVITPAKEVYDDGIYRVQFSSFYVIDSEGNKVVSAGEVFDYPTKIKLSEGSYQIFYKNFDRKLVQKDLKVEKGNCLQIILD